MYDRVDSELIEGLDAFFAMSGSDGVDLKNISEVRSHSASILEQMKSLLPVIKGVSTEDRYVLGPENAPDVAIRIYRPEISKKLPVLLWIHGGGYVVGSVDQDDILVKQLCLAAECVIVSVEYRLAPENPYPAPLDDCYAVLKWINQQANALNVDAAKIAIGGASAGAGLAAGLALLARDRGEIPLWFQLLIYPMIDDSNTKPASNEFPDTLMWTRQNNLIGWRSYLGCEPGSANISSYAAPFRAKNLSGLPRAYIAVGELDLFLEENIDYATRLLRAGVSTELQTYSGAFHGFDVLAPVAEVSQRFSDDRNKALNRAFKE